MLKVIAPNGNVVAIDQVTPSDNSYSATIGVGGSQYSQDGMYTIIATQSAGSVADVSGPSAIVNGVLISHTVYQSITASTEVEDCRRTCDSRIWNHCGNDTCSGNYSNNCGICKDKTKSSTKILEHPDFFIC